MAYIFINRNIVLLDFALNVEKNNNRQFSWTGETVITLKYICISHGVNIALRRFLHNHGNIETEGSPKPGLCPTFVSNDKGSL